jgi:hypothetical protein
MGLRRPSVRCHARRTSGEACGNYAMHGGHVCHAHGGRAPQTRKAAAIRMTKAWVEREVSRLAERDQVRREALAPWTGELGPSTYWPLASPAKLRRIASEMRVAARLLCAQAAENERVSSS